MKKDYSLGPSALDPIHCSDCDLEYGTPHLAFWISYDKKAYCSNCYSSFLEEALAHILNYHQTRNDSLKEFIKQQIKDAKEKNKQRIIDLEKLWRKELKKKK